jgi:tyrosyl-tRNA synthetase
MDPVEAKMSKSDPRAAVTVNDSPQEIEQKIAKAFCPKEVEGNPVLEIFRLLIFEGLAGEPLVLRRDPKYGAAASFGSYGDLEKAYLEGSVHPGDLKAEAARRLVALTEPVRAHFEKHPQHLAWLGTAAAGR